MTINTSACQVSIGRGQGLDQGLETELTEGGICKGIHWEGSWQLRKRLEEWGKGHTLRKHGGTRQRSQGRGTRQNRYYTQNDEEKGRNLHLGFKERGREGEQKNILKGK